jgi:hypothetical protein
MMLRKAKVCASDSRRGERPGRTDSLFAPFLTVYSQVSENRSRKGHNSRRKHMFVARQRRH